MRPKTFDVATAEPLLYTNELTAMGTLHRAHRIGEPSANCLYRQNVVCTQGTSGLWTTTSTVLIYI
jgi:hypothetical protein